MCAGPCQVDGMATASMDMGDFFYYTLDKSSWLYFSAALQVRAATEPPTAFHPTHQVGMIARDPAALVPTQRTSLLTTGPIRYHRRHGRQNYSHEQRHQLQGQWQGQSVICVGYSLD